MGSCCSCGYSNKIVPLEENKKPTQVTDNFVIRERGDGESLRDSDAEKSKNQSLTLDRHVSGSSFSSKSCASRSIDELEEDEDLLAYLNTNSNGRDVISRYDMLSEVASEVKTEGGLTDVALDLDHPFAPLYEGEEELDEAMLSRPRSVGLRGRSSYTRDVLSQMSNFSELDSFNDNPIRDDTPVPGKKGNSSMSILSKRKKKRGNNTNRSKRNSSLLVTREDSDVHSTPRSNRGSTPGSFSLTSSVTIRTDDGGSSLTSSTSSLSAIGEISEGGSASTVGRSARTIEPLPSKQPRIQRQVSKESTNKENVPPTPLPRISKRNINAPKSADIIASEKEVQPAQGAPKSAESVLGGRQDSYGSRSKVESRKSSRGSERYLKTPTSYSNDAWKAEEILRTSTPAQNNLSVDLESLHTYKPRPAQRQLFKSSTNENIESPLKPVITEKPQILPKPTNRSNKTTVKNFSAPKTTSGPNKNQIMTSPIPPARSRDISSWINSKPDTEESQYSLSKPATAMPNNRQNIYNIVQDRPMAARPRRPATAVENMLINQGVKQKLPHMVSDELLSDESMDEESHPDPPQSDPKFRTIIII